MADTSDTTLGAELDRLWQTILARKGADPDTSYTAKLLAGGVDAPAQKLGEEAIETLLAAVSGNVDHTAAEAADLLYHLLVTLAAAGVDPADVAAKLTARTGQSGLEEKASRKK